MVCAFGPQSGCLLYKQVTAVATTNRGGNGKYVFSGGVEGQVRVWKIDRNNELQTLVATTKEHRSLVTQLKVDRDDEEVVSSGDDGTIYSWDYDHDEGEVICVGEGHADDISTVAWSNDGKRIITGALDGGVYLWNLE